MAQDDVAEFAALLRRLKARTDRSYGSLARRLAMNTSTLHRYCAGDAVPQDFAPVERFAALCEATPQERLELHRRWILAVAARQRPRTAPAATTEPEPAPAGPADRASEPGPTPRPASGPGPHVTSAAAPEPAPVPAPDPAREPLLDSTTPPASAQASEPAPEDADFPGARPWYRRRRATVTAAVACVLLATLGGLSALPTDRRPVTGGPAPAPRSHPATAPASPGASASATSSASSGPSPSPGPSRTDGPAATGAEGSPTAHGPGGTAGPKPAAPSGVPLTWTADSQVWAQGCGHDYVIDKSPGQVPPPPAPQDAGTWAATQGAVHGRETTIRISVQGRTSTAVVLEALRVRVVGRAEPVPGTAYAMDQGCGGSLSPRHFAVDLDVDRPIARSVAGNDAGTPIPAVRMPYRVSAEDPEVLLVTARTETCGCAWYLELDWSSQGRTGTVRIDDRGRPFRTSAIEDLQRYMYDTLNRRWTPYR
ncbi:helix-turn-helix domain-containing protein [Streptomyces cadmiisoli]|uniref:helix-turn-helix domain-containing protein n=1 Tax=Streptomyces cadmiisoli TaxID=2184053 RepID=UPI0036581DC9